jgi:dihydrofolate reductase
MARLRVHGFTISIDGYGAGPDQDLAHPLGIGGEALHQWLIGTKTFRKQTGHLAESGIAETAGREGIDDHVAARGFENLGAWIMGRNMFGPVRGPWPDGSWKGWWGDDPPYHVPVFVLTHHARPPLTMEGGTVFHFVADGIHAALDRAMDAARGRDVRLGGGVATIREYLRAGLIDQLNIAISPVLLGRGEHLLAGIDTVALGYTCTEHVGTDLATHVVLEK